MRNNYNAGIPDELIDCFLIYSPLAGERAPRSLGRERDRDTRQIHVNARMVPTLA